MCDNYVNLFGASGNTRANIEMSSQSEEPRQLVVENHVVAVYTLFAPWLKI